MTSDSDFEEVPTQSIKSSNIQKNLVFSVVISIIFDDQTVKNLISDDYARLATEVRRYQMLYDKSHPDYMKSKLKKDVWRTVAQRIGTIDGKKIDGLKGKTFFNSGKTKLVNMQKAVKSGSGAESSAKTFEREQMFKIFSFLKDHLEPKSYVLTFCDNIFTTHESLILA